MAMSNAGLGGRPGANDDPRQRAIGAPREPRWTHVTRRIGAAAAGFAPSATASFAVVSLLMLGRWWSGFPATIQLQYWYLSYSQGLIRRGLVGTLTTPWLVGLPLPDAMFVISKICVAAALALIATLAFTFYAYRLRWHDPIVLLFIASNCLPFAAHDLGTLDVFIMLLSLWVLFLIGRRSLFAAPVALLAILMHEGALFFMLPMLGGVWLRHRSSRTVVALTATSALAGAALLWKFASNTYQWPVGMPAVDAVALHNFIAQQLTQNPRLLVPRVDWHSIVFSMLPCLLMCCVVSRRAGWRASGIVLGGTLVTWSLVLIALDVDRLLSWSPLTAAILAGMLLSPRAVQSAARPVAGLPMECSEPATRCDSL